MSEERLKRIEILLETCAKTTVANQAEIRSLIKQTSENQAEIKEVRQQMASLSEMFIESIGIMKTMQSDIKGLQTENKRILDHLFGNTQE
jgi:predicted  nucleic acid-binding Zn-ribbon protein